MAKQLKIVVVGGGTGGHVTPTLAVADQLKALGAQVWFVGGAGGMERELVTQAGYPFYGIQAGKLRRYFSWENFIDIFRVIIGFVQSWLYLMRLRPAIVFTKGGYVTVPFAYAAAFLEIPLVAHESDVVMGLANRLVASKAKLICTGFPVDSYSSRIRAKLRFTGNPIRSLFQEKRQPLSETLKQLGFVVSRPVVMVLGSSQGALGINQRILERLPEALKHFQLIHLTGPDHIDAAYAAKAELPVSLAKRYQPFGYVAHELADYMAAADVVVSRASASVLAELAYLKKPTILIPLPSAASDHQRANARIFRKEQAAVVLEETSLTSEQLLGAITKLLDDKKQRAQLSRHIHAFSSPQAASIIAETIVQCVK